MKIEDKVDAVYIPDNPSRIKATDYNQIKNEIQECISLAGLTPTKDVIQLPESLKILTKQSGTEEIEKIAAAGSAQLSSINTAGNTQKAAVETAGATQKSAVESAGSQQVASVNTAGAIQTANAAAQAELAKKWANKTDGPVEGGEYSAKKYALDAAQSAKNASKLSVGTVFFSQSNLATDNPGALPLFTGETIASADTLYPDFYAWLQNHSGLTCTAAEYEAALSTYGECPKYVLTSASAASYSWDFSSWSFGERSFGSMEGNEYKPVSGSPVFYTNTSDINVSEKTSLYLDKACTQPLYSQYQDGNVLKTVSLSLQKVANNARMFQNDNGSITAVYGTDTAGATNIVFLPVTQFQEIPAVSTASLRLPLLKNYVKCANETDGITQKEAGLPNITGELNAYGFNNGWNKATGPFASNEEYLPRSDFQNGNGVGLSFDASRVSTVYGKSNTVTPPHTTLYPWVCAYNAAVPASTAQAAEFQQALSGKLDLPTGKIQADVDLVVESYLDADGNWYRKYKSGWLEQGGVVDVQANSQYSGNLLKPFNNYLTTTFIATDNGSALNAGVYGYQQGCGLSSNTTFFIRTAYDSMIKVSWYACGPGAEE